MAIPSDRQSAQELVRQITRDHGYLSAEKFQQIGDPILRREIEEAFMQKDLLIGSAVITLAKNLYSSKARFVFELLQNADNNGYTKAKELGDVPYVSFRVYPLQVVLECNEDGFTEKDLAAICSVGQSSKTAAQGYIGEKGIGFKSVFIAAYKVHIQSGAFSFSFTHKSGQSGMGMISPQWEDTTEELEPPLTRITLHLHNDGDSEMLAGLHESIRNQFAEIQETFLLFMRNLRRVYVAFYDEHGEQTSSVTYSADRPEPNHAIVKTTKVADGSTQEETKCYHVTTHEVTNLAKNENRAYSKDEETARVYSKSQIVLAFPLSEASVPIIEEQNLFVFLPVRPVGFNFIIQADFVTDASRKDVVKDSLRNNDLLDCISDAFAKAILQLCEHENLRYKWMRYLPDRNDKNWGPLWLSLVNKIADRVSKTAVLYGQKRPDRRFIRDLYRLMNDDLDEDGKPLFDDGDPEQIISQRYIKSDLDLLSDYGLQYAYFSNTVERLRKDLEQGGLSRMMSPGTTESWHTRAAKLLSLPFTKGWDARIAELENLHLLPLKGGTWVSASSGPVYFAYSNGMNIPLDLDLRLISKSVTNPHRLTLLKHLGVKTASASLVRKRILQRYPRLEGQASALLTTLKTSKHHLKFLYQTEHLKDDDEPSYSRLAIHDRRGIQCQPRSTCMYITNAKSYGPWELLRKTDPGPKPGDGAPGYAEHDVRFVNEAYFTDSPSPPPDQKLTWLEWFHAKLGVEKYITFNHDKVLKGAAKYLQQYRPEKFLGALCIWRQERGFLSPELIEHLRETEVLCRGNRRALLKNAYFPTEELEQRVEWFIEPGAFFPWLWLDTETTHDAIPSEWKDLLKQLGVGIPVKDLDIALDMLKYSLDAFPSTTPSQSRERLFDLYHHIQSKYREDNNREEAREKIRVIFSERKCIYIPLSPTHCAWAFPSDCVWEAPQEMKTKFALQRLYEPCLHLDDADSSSLTYFFTSILGITDCTWETYVGELKELKEAGCLDIDTITVVYGALNALRPTISSDSEKDIKSAFENDALIYVPSDDGPAWHKVSQCVWSRAARLRGRVSLNEEYADLEELFVGFLGVKPVDLLMAIDELKEAGNRRPISVEEVTESIWTVNSLLSTESTLPNPRAIMASNVFPIIQPIGVVICVSATTEFFVRDRETLAQSFAGKVKFLNFSLEKVVQLRPFLEWTGLHNRYLSLCVRESTSFHGRDAMPISNPKRQIRNRAYALLRVAAHFGSPRTRSNRDLHSFYQELRNVQIRGTDGISSIFHVSQDGVSHDVEGKKTTLFMDEHESGLRIYMPRNEDDQEYTFTKLLAQRLFEWMMKDQSPQGSKGVNTDGINATRDVLLAPRTRLATALDDNGIATLDTVDLDEEDLSESESPATPQGAADAPLVRDDNDLGAVGTPPSSTASPPVDLREAAASSQHSFSLAQSRPRLYSTDSLSLPMPPAMPPQTVTGDPQYVALLSKVLTAARSSTIPSMTRPRASQASRYDGSHLRLHYDSQTERDCKIGAAGELYVFELLSHLGLPTGPLPGFSRSNWKSNIRRYVNVHPEYSDLEPWSGTETSDIVYPNSTGVLTGLLINKGYLGRDMSERKPNYLIEVKTTVSSCETPFYMSKYQYARMKRSDTVYAIFRVYNLGRDDMALQIYLDPEALRVSEQLLFTAETWSVVPANA